MDPRDILLFAPVGVCAITDLRAGRIYNKVTYLMLLGLVVCVWLQGPKVPFPAFRDSLSQACR